MARDLGSVLAPSLNAGPVPEQGRALVAYAGGTRALAQQLSGMDGPPARRDFPTPEGYEAARTTWRTASRNAQRYAKGRRPSSETLTPARKGRVRRQANARRREDLAQAGLRARLKARLSIGSPGKRSDSRVRVIPSGGPGVYISPAQVRDVLDELGGDREAAAEDFMDAFWTAYRWDDAEDVVEIDEVIWLRVWPDGEPESGAT